MPTNVPASFQNKNTQQDQPILVNKPRYTLWLLRMLGVIFAGAVIAWALAEPMFRNTEGDVTGAICLPVAAGVGLIVLGFAIGTSLARAGFWLALALVGQGISLQMVYAGPKLHYQHYKHLSELLAYPGIIYLFIFIVQAALVVYGFRNRWPVLLNWLRGNFRTWQIICIGLTFIFSSATVSQSVSFFASELVFASFVQLISLGTIILVLWEIPESALIKAKSWFAVLFGDPTPTASEVLPGKVDRFVVIAAVWVIIVSALLNVVSYQSHPHLQDEVAYLYQARYLAQGKLASPAPPDQQGFEMYLMQLDGARWYPSTPPGWPAVLAVGVLLGAPGMVDPVLGGINILLLYLLLQRLYSRRLARISVFLLCLSPWYIFLAMSYMTHTFMLTCALAATVGVVWSRQSGKAGGVLLAGIALGVMSWIRPVDGLLMAALVGMWAIGLGGSRLKIKAIAILVVATGVVASVILPFNQYLTGKASEFPLNVYLEQKFGPNSNRLGFGPDRGMGWAIDPNPGHSPLDAMINADLNTYAINVELFGWSIGSLLLAAIFIFSGKYKTSDFLMMALIIAVFGVYFLYYFSGGPDFGARYWYLMIVPLVSLSVRGIQVLESKLASVQFGFPALGERLLVGVVVVSLIALVNFFPWRAIDKYFHYLEMRPDMRVLAQTYDFGNSLVFVRGEEFPDYASAAAYNPVDMRSSQPIYARLRSQESLEKIVSAYSDRPIWFVDGPTLTGQGFKVVAGPLTSNQVLSGSFVP